MKRRALILWCDSRYNLGYASPSQDWKLLMDFLLSPLGGAWEEDEIFVLSNPQAHDVREAQKKMGGADFTLTFFSGYGVHSRLGRDLKLQLADGAHPTELLRNPSQKQLILLEPERRHPTAQSVLIPDLWRGDDRTSATGCRQVYDTAIERSSNGVFILAGTDKTGQGIETPEGSGYIVSLLKAAQDFADRRGKENVLDLHVAHARAATYLRVELGSKQYPIHKPQKRRNRFPWAVKG